MESVLDLIFLSVLFMALFFEVFLLVTYFEHRKSFKEKFFPRASGDESLPSVTIIVPCWNEEKTIAKTLESLARLDYPADKLSIFVIDDGSNDGTREAAKNFLSDTRFRYFYKENGGKYSALNFGLSQTTADLVGCLDADSFVAQDALRIIAAAFRPRDVMAVTPAIRVHEPKTWIQKIQDAEYTLGILFKKILAILNAQYVTPGPFSIYRKAVFETAGIFKHAHQTEDMEMALRMHSKKLRIENALDAEVYTIAPETFQGILQQRLRWTYGFVRNTADYRFMLFRKQYGNLGLFSLPFALISLGAVIYSALYFLWHLFQFASDTVLEFSSVGWFSVARMNASWFFINTKITALLALVSVGFFFLLLVLSIRRVRGGFAFKGGDLYFILLYGLIAPLWVFRTAVKLFSNVPLKWR